jgi:hypothetical protein
MRMSEYTIEDILLFYYLLVITKKILYILNYLL